MAMKSVYETSSGLDGHMILNLLEQYRISGRIEGEHLQGGMGELQALGFVRVMVAEEDYEQAKQIIREWEALQPPDETHSPVPRETNGIQLFLAGVIIGAALMYWLLKLGAA
ncbi:MAG: DUF2007 domain-containing protein [Sideroxydans sp.]|nr:DUF2007 domain-containing protein [Sideroxydans sp.]